MSSLHGLEIGAIIGRDFRLREELASGSMGTVYVVEQISTGKLRALKVMSRELANNDRARNRFILEARIGGQIESDHVVEVVSAGIDEVSGVPYLVMELLRGEVLEEMLYRLNRLKLRDVAEVLRQCGHALGKAHKLGIVHRDIKPENIFIAESRRQDSKFTAKILDFGIAKLVAERTAEGTQAVGTPIFMAPEQTEKGVVTPAADVWSLGLLAYYLLTGELYWANAEDGLGALLREVVLEPLVPARQRAATQGVDSYLPEGFDQWFSQCVNRDLQARYQNAADAAAAFGRLVPANESLGELSASMLKVPHSLPPDISGSGSVIGAAAMQAATQHMTQLASTGLGVGGEPTDVAPPAPEKPKEGSNSKLFLGLAALGAIVVGGIAFFAFNAGSSESGSASTSAGSGTAAPATATVVVPTPPKELVCPAGMIKIKGGNLILGSLDDDLADNVRPPHKVALDEYCLDTHEVTAKQFMACASSGNCVRLKATVEFAGLTDARRKVFDPLCNEEKVGRGDHPMNCIDWKSAQNYCSTKGGRLPTGGGRLPTEAEWEYAARGAGQRVYPWGDDAPTAKHLNACGEECKAWSLKNGEKVYGTMYPGDDGYAATAPVGAYPAGKTPTGLLDLAGNVWEWTGDWYGPYTAGELENPTGPKEGKQRVARGGAFNGFKPAWAKPAYRWKTDPASRSHGIGFRCALAASP